MAQYEVELAVNRVSASERTARVDFQGTEVNAVIPLLSVEMYDPEGLHGSITLYMHTPEDRQWGADYFKEGGKVKVTFEPVG